MDIKNWCETCWASPTHAPEPMKEDGGGRMMVFAPEGETCSFCEEPATHTAELLPMEEAAVALHVDNKAPVVVERRPSKRPQWR